MMPAMPSGDPERLPSSLAGDAATEPPDSDLALLLAESPALLAALSPLGRRVRQPASFLPLQSAEARGKRFNATIGQITDGAGRALPLPAMAEACRLPAPAPLSGAPFASIARGAPTGRAPRPEPWRGPCDRRSTAAPCNFQRAEEVVMDQLWQALDWALGFKVKPESITVVQVALRTLVAYSVGWALLRLASNRLLSRYTAFDVVLGFVLGSTLSRAINGAAPLDVTYAAVVLLVALHQFLAWLCYHSSAANALLNGHAQPLIRSGRVLSEQMRKNYISDSDLDEELRLGAHTTEIERVEEARIERNGEISFLKRPQVVEVAVREGVQSIRIELVG